MVLRNPCNNEVAVIVLVAIFIHLYNRFPLFLKQIVHLKTPTKDWWHVVPLFLSRTKNYRSVFFSYVSKHKKSGGSFNQATAQKNLLGESQFSAKAKQLS